MRKTPVFLFATAVIVGCGQPPTGGHAPVESACSAAGAQFAVGRPLSAQLEADARARSGAKIVRVLRPGEVVTMEFNPQRLNIQVDAAGRVTGVTCG